MVPTGILFLQLKPFDSNPQTVLRCKNKAGGIFEIQNQFFFHIILPKILTKYTESSILAGNRVCHGHV